MSERTDDTDVSGVYKMQCMLELRPTKRPILCSFLVHVQMPSSGHLSGGVPSTADDCFGLIAVLIGRIGSLDL